MQPINLANRPILLDGGMGRELRSRGVNLLSTIWSATGLIDAPNIVRQIHEDYIDAGADLITTNTYGVIRSNLAQQGLEDRFQELNILACTLAQEARQNSGASVLIAGSLPPLGGSFRPDLVGKAEEIEPLYLAQAELLAPHIDLFLCETMSSIAEAGAAARAAYKFGKPVWVAFTLHEDRSGNLRSGEKIAAAAESLAQLPVSGILANCCAPESITNALPGLADSGFAYFGGYANAFEPIPKDWKLDGDKPTDGYLDLRTDLDPASYAIHVERWLKMGANVVGGCCGTGPAHIAKINESMRSIGVDKIDNSLV